MFFTTVTVIQELEIVIEAANPDAILRKRKAISALLLYAIRLAGDGNERVVGAFLRAARASGSPGFTWRRIEPFMTTLFDKPGTPSLDRVITLVSPYLRWDNPHFNQNTVTRWSTAVLTVPYTEEIGQSAVDTLLQIASIDSLQRHIPVSIWSWSNDKTFLPPTWLGAHIRTPEVIRQIRALGNTEILRSYLLLVWLEWSPLDDSTLTEMYALIKEDFNGIGMERHREDLRKRLNLVLRQLDLGPECFKGHRPDLGFSTIQDAKGHYGELERVLLEVDREAMEILTRTPSRFDILFDSLTSVNTYRNPLDIHVSPPSSVSVISTTLTRSANSILVCTWVSDPLTTLPAVRHTLCMPSFDF